jgi:hypothetical protein
MRASVAQLTMALTCEICNKQQSASACILSALTMAHAGDPTRACKPYQPQITCNWERMLEAVQRDFISWGRLFKQGQQE